MEKGDGMTVFSYLPNGIKSIFQDQPSKSWLLSESEYNKLQKYNNLVLVVKNINIKVQFYNELMKGFHNTSNGTEAHGLYVALINNTLEQHPDLKTYLAQLVPSLGQSETTFSRTASAAA